MSACPARAKRRRAGNDVTDAPALSRPAVAAALLFAEAAILGYALHRLAFSLAGEPDPRTVGATAHVGYYWRVATSLWWGTIASAAGWRWPTVGPFAWRAFWPCVALAAVIAILVP